MSSGAKFILKSDPQKVFEVGQEEFLIGRLQECEIAVYDPHVSGRQARVSLEHGEHIIENLGRNPTLVNGIPITKHFLQNGDQIIVGTTQFVFEIEPQERAVASEEPSFEQPNSFPVLIAIGRNPGSSISPHQYIR